MDIIRNSDNFSSSYDFILNQLFIYDYNNDADLKKLKLKISSLDAEITQEESLGLELSAQTMYHPNQYVVFHGGTGTVLLQCNTLHYSSIYNCHPLPQPTPFEIKTQYYASKTVNTEIFNGDTANFLQVSYPKYGDIVTYQDNLYNPISDFISTTEFIVTDWNLLTVIEFESNTFYSAGTILLFKNNYYIVVNDYTSQDDLIVYPSYDATYFTTLGSVPVWESSLSSPINHYESLKNELDLLKVYIESVNANDTSIWDDEKQARLDNVSNYTSQVNRITGFNNIDYNLAYNKRPSLLTDTQFENLRLAYNIKLANNELGSVDDIINKPGKLDSANKNAKNETASVNGFQQPDLITPTIRKNGVSELAEEEPRLNFSDNTYDEIHDLIYATLCPDAVTRSDLRFSKGWRPNYDYSAGDFIDTFQEENITSVYDVSLIDNSDLYDTWDDYGREGHIWICRTSHTSTNVYPRFNVGKLTELPTDDELDDPQLKIWIDPDSGSPTYQSALWVRPMWGALNKDYINNPEPSVYPAIQWYLDIVYESQADSDATSMWESNSSWAGSIPGSEATGSTTVTEIIPETHAFYEFGILPLVFYHHNATNNPSDEQKNLEYTACNQEDIGGILKEQFTYKVTDTNSIGSDGLPLDCVLVQWEDMVFRVIQEFSTLECPAMPGTVTSQILNYLPYLSYVGNVKCIKSEWRIDPSTSEWLRGDDPVPTRWWGIAFASQRDYIGYQNPCCCNPPMGLDPQPIRTDLGPLRRTHNLVKCGDCGFEYDDWGTTLCPICGGVTSYSRWDGNTPPNPELGRILIAQSCGRKSFEYNSSVSQAQFGQACYDYGLSPTSGCFHTVGNDVSDCMPCYGIWKLTPEQLNAPIDDKSLTYKKRNYINLLHNGSIAGYEWPCLAGILDIQHTASAIGYYYGTPEECFEEVSIVRYISGAIEKVKTASDLPSGSSDADQISYERFIVLNRRLRVNRQIINNKTVSIGDKQIGKLLGCVNIPNLRDDFVQKIEDQKNQKFNMGEYLKETSSEWS